MSRFNTLDMADLNGKRVLVRVDLNVPMENGRVTDTTRIERILPTIREISDKGGRVVLLAHFDRPKGKVVPEMSLAGVVSTLAEMLGRPVAFGTDCIGPMAEAAVRALKDGDVVLLENTRFHKGEEENDTEFAKALAANGDIYVNDAFSAAHRAHASTEGIAQLLPSYAGRTMQAELDALEAGLGNPQRPVVAIVGGAKVSTKLDLLANLVDKGRCAGHRRRHGQHLPCGQGGRCRQIAVRARPRRNRPRNPRQGGKGRLHGHSARRRCGRPRVQGERRQRNRASW